jgi:hypothetical protein
MAGLITLLRAPQSDAGRVTVVERILSLMAECERRALVPSKAVEDGWRTLEAFVHSVPGNQALLPRFPDWGCRQVDLLVDGGEVVPAPKSHAARVPDLRALALQLACVPGLIATIPAPALTDADVRLAASWLTQEARVRLAGADLTTLRGACRLSRVERGNDYWEVERCLSARRAERLVLGVRSALGQVTHDLSRCQTEHPSDDRWAVADIEADGEFVDVKNARYDSEKRTTRHLVKRFKKDARGKGVRYDGVRSAYRTLDKYARVAEPGDVVYLGSATRERLDYFASLVSRSVAVESEQFDPRGTLLPGWCFELPARAYEQHYACAQELQRTDWMRALGTLGAAARARWEAHEAENDTFGDLDPVAAGDSAGERTESSPEPNMLEVEHALASGRHFAQFHALLLSFGLDGVPLELRESPGAQAVNAMARRVSEVGRWPALLIAELLDAFLAHASGRAPFSNVDAAVLFFPSRRMPLCVYDPTESVFEFYQALEQLTECAHDVLRDIERLRLCGPRHLQGIARDGSVHTLIVHCRCGHFPLIRGLAKPCVHGDGKLECTKCRGCPHQPSRAAES